MPITTEGPIRVLEKENIVVDIVEWELIQSVKHGHDLDRAQGV